MNDNLEVKAFGAFEIKDAARGEVSAVVATLGVVDRDGDVMLPGSFPLSAAVKLSAYGHSIVTDGAAPVGKGTITVEGDRAIFRGKFFMKTERGREAFAVVEEDGEDGEWSFGFPKKVKTATMTKEWRDKGARRIIAELVPVEASPVFIGAGIGTGTLSTKDAGDEIEPDPAIEAARIETERQAQEAEEKAQRATEINTGADRLFKRRAVR